jgi:hypothetical protein
MEYRGIKTYAIEQSKYILAKGTIPQKERLKHPNAESVSNG